MGTTDENIALHKNWNNSESTIGKLKGESGRGDANSPKSFNLQFKKEKKKKDAAHWMPDSSSYERTKQLWRHWHEKAAAFKSVLFFFVFDFG